jgi:hypothetical protein
MGKQLKYQTKEELLVTAKAMGVKGLNKTMTKAAIMSKLEAPVRKSEAKTSSKPYQGEY